jgi:hypothetical protein
MNKKPLSHTQYLLLLILLLTALAWTLASSPLKADDLQRGFQTPADAYKPHTWWHWMNGHVTRESITRDLEDMKRIGLGGFTLWNTHEGIPKGPVKYASEPWWDLLEHTMNEAERLGFQMGIFNCAGWSSTGAAFVTPDKAMQEVAWTETQVKGPGKVDLMLEIPKAALGIERDMKRDPIINRRYYMPREHVEGRFRDIAVFAVPSIPRGQTPWRLKDWRNKAAFGKMAHRFEPDTRKAPAGQVIGQDRIINISEFMHNNGELHWEAPAGNWTILRMGYQPTGRNNHPASYGGRGLEIDKMSSAAMDFYWEHFLDRVVKTAGDRIDETFFGVNIDSYEVGHQNWNRDFAQAFEDAKGYDIRTFLPVVTGRIVESVEFTERILWDYRKVIGDLIAENYYGRMAERTHAAGLQFADEPYGSYGNTNDFVVAGKVDIPTCEWWANDEGKQLGRPAEAKLAASAAHTYGRTMVDSEAFTGRPQRIFESHPGGIKVQGDFYLAQGVNRFSFHTWVHDPYNVGPGLGLGTYGSRFDNRNTWWPFARPWHQYLSRCFYLLQQGKFVGDVLYYVGEEAPLRSERLRRDTIMPTLSQGYDYAFCNTEILGQLKWRNGHLKTDKGSSFRVLVLPESPWMSIDVLRKIRRLLDQGAVVVGSKPESLPGKVSKPALKRFEALVTKLWDTCDGQRVTSHRVGKGILYWGVSLDEILEKHGISPDFRFTHKTRKAFGPTPYPGGDIEFIHRRVGTNEIYFLTNQHAEAKTVYAKFRVTGRQPELWCPDSGKIHRLTQVRTAGAHTEFQLHFGPEEAYFVVFREPGQATAKQPAPWLTLSKAVMDLSQDWTVEFATETPTTIHMPKLVPWPKLEEDTLRFHSGTATYRKTFERPASLATSHSPLATDLGDVHVIAQVKINGVDCGIAWKKPYRVEVTQAVKPGKNTIEITVANLWVNRLIGDQRFPDDLTWTDDTGSTAQGQGLTHIPDWAKIGAQRPEPRRKTFYAWKWPHMTADRELLPSGLLGPVKLIRRTPGTFSSRRSVAGGL